MTDHLTEARAHLQRQLTEAEGAVIRLRQAIDALDAVNGRAAPKRPNGLVKRHGHQSLHNLAADMLREAPNGLSVEEVRRRLTDIRKEHIPMESAYNALNKLRQRHRAISVDGLWHLDDTPKNP